MKKFGFVLLLLALTVSGLEARDNSLEDAFQALLDKALQLNIVARILPPGTQPVWNMKSSKVTIPGKSVAVRLVGKDLRIDVVFTPYQEEDGKLLLVAQGQVWLMEAPERETRYISSFKSIPISLGEKVLFFPLGFSGELTRKESFIIQLEIEVLAYKDPEEASN